MIIKKIIKYLENKIYGCDNLGGMQREKAVYQSVLKWIRNKTVSKSKKSMYRNVIMVLDGFDSISTGVYIAPISVVDSFEIGLTDIYYDEDNNELYLECRRPGLLIGKGGQNINKIKSHLKVKEIFVEEKTF